MLDAGFRMLPVLILIVCCYDICKVHAAFLGMKQLGATRAAVVLPSSSSSDQEDDGFVEYRSVSDYMGGHHAGKFDFDTRLSGVTSLNYEKSKVIDNVVFDRRKKSMVAEVDDEAIPPWATRSIKRDVPSLSVSGSPEEAGAGTIDLRETGVAEAEITNDELSWEPFYATVEREDGSQVSFHALSVTPSSGKLAPRGGADPYSDTCLLTVSRHEDLIENGTPNRFFLVVRTEQDHWCWSLLM